MHIFSEPVDKRSREAMTTFLARHFRYNTMNSWNKARSFACNLKINRLGLESDIVDKLYDLMAKNNEVVEKIIYVPQTRLVMAGV